MIRSNISKTISLCLCLGILGCTQESPREKIVQDWHPAINETLTSLHQNNILTFGKMNKEDGRYCYVSYEGILRNSEELVQTQKHLNHITKEIAQILKTEFSQTTLDLTKKTQSISLDQMSDKDLAYIHKKSELECLLVLAERQIAKYAKRTQDSRLTSN